MSGSARATDRAGLPDLLRLPRPIAEELVAHALSELPNEACGLLSGSLATGTVARYLPARNAMASPWRFDVAPEDLVRLVVGIEAAGEDLVAVFHSHTRTPAVPSPTDAREARYPALHVIATLADQLTADTLRAWRIDGTRSVEVALRIG